MAKRKFNREERNAIIQKLENIAVEIILMNQDDPIDELIEKLLEGCLCK